MIGLISGPAGALMIVTRVVPVLEILAYLLEMVPAAGHVVPTPSILT
jgi:hypothetical protein